MNEKLIARKAVNHFQTISVMPAQWAAGTGFDTDPVHAVFSSNHSESAENGILGSRKLQTIEFNHILLNWSKEYVRCRLTMKLMTIKLLKATLAVSIIATITLYSTIELYASDICLLDGEYYTNAYTLYDNISESCLYQMLADEKVNYSGLISEQNEIFLNSIGIFDDEIADFSEDSLIMLQGECLISAYVMYFGTDKNGYLIEYNADEVDNYFVNRSVSETENTEETVSSLISNETVNASTTSKSDTEIDTSGMLKQVLILAQYTTGGDITVSYSASWLSMPFYLSTDIFGVTLDNMSPDKSTLQAYYRYAYTQTTIMGLTSIEYSASGEKNLISSGQYLCGSKCVTCYFKFNHSRSDIIAAALGDSTITYTYNKVLLYFHATIDDKKSRTYVSATGDYWHEKSAVNITPSISIDADGAGFSISASQEKYYTVLSPNTYTKLTFK